MHDKLNVELQLELQPLLSAQYERMSYTAKLDMIGLNKIVELVAEGYPLTTSRRSKSVGITNQLGVTDLSFNKWLIYQPMEAREDLTNALLVQSIQLKQTMLEAALDTVCVRETIVHSRTPGSDKIASSRAKASTALQILNVIDKETDKVEQSSSSHARPVEANIISTDESREKLIALRELKK